MCVQTIHKPSCEIQIDPTIKKNSCNKIQPVATVALSERRQSVQKRNSNKKVAVVNLKNGDTKKTISAASVATTAVIAGTTSAVSGVGVTILQHIIGFSVYLAYSPTNIVSQYATAQIAASMAGAIVSSPIIYTIINIAFGVLITLSTIFVSVIIYNLFLANSYDDELSVFQVIGHTISTVFRKVFS